MRILSHLLSLNHGLLDRNSTKAPLGSGHTGLANMQVWCRGSVLLLLREKERLQ